MLHRSGDTLRENTSVPVISSKLSVNKHGSKEKKETC